MGNPKSIEDLVTEALNTVYEELGERAQNLTQSEMEAAVVYAAREYVRTCYDFANPLEV